MNEFHDDSQIDVTRADDPGGGTGEQGENRTQSFAAAAARILEVSFDGRVESFGLLADAFLDGVKMRVN